jgi:hypothetical protein
MAFDGTAKPTPAKAPVVENYYAQKINPKE